MTDMLHHVDRFGVTDPCPESIRVFLTKDGLGVTREIIANYGAGFEFSYTVPADRLMFLERMIIYIEDDAQLAANKYGGIAALTNGITLIHRRGAVTLHDFTGGSPVKTNGGIAQHCYDVQPIDFGPGIASVVGRWTMAKAGHPMALRAGDEIVALVEDDFTGLVSNTIKLEGYSYHLTGSGLGVQTVVAP